MINDVMKQEVITLNLPTEATQLLQKKNITTINKLCKKSKTDLMKIGIDKGTTDTILIKLQLLGLNLKKAL